VCKDFQSVYQTDREEAGKAALEASCAKWDAAYPKAAKSLKENPHIFTFYRFPKSIWRSIYSTNLIESFNKQIKRYTNPKEQFPP
jgi:transposase-like protein